MNFIWFTLAIIVFEIFFWYVISMVLFVPALPFVALLAHAEEMPYEKRGRKALLFLSGALAFIFGTLLTCMIYGGGIAWTTLIFARNATHPWIYYTIAGFLAFFISAPSGETNLLGMILSFASYLIVVLMKKVELVAEGFFEGFFAIMSIIFWIAVVILIGYAIWHGANFVVKRLICRNKISESEGIVSQIGFFKGYCILNLVLFLGTLILVVLYVLFFSQYTETNDVVPIVLGLVGTLIFWILLYRLYKVSASLKEEGLLSIRPWVVLVITILLTYGFPIASVVPFVVIWKKCNKYLRLRDTGVKSQAFLESSDNSFNEDLSSSSDMVKDESVEQAESELDDLDSVSNSQYSTAETNFIFHCWKCGTKLQIDSSMRGHATECPKCGAELKIPKD